VLEQASAGCENVPQITLLKRKSIPIQHQGSLLLPRPTAFVPTEELQISMDQITLHSSEGYIQAQEQRCMATYRPRTSQTTLLAMRVIVEWKTFDKETSSSIQFSQLSRIDNLARLLHISSKPPGLCVPQCLGYVRQEWPARIGYVFQLALGEQHNAGALPSPASMTKLTSLHDLLSSNEIPYLGDRFKLALQLSSSLSILHKAGWLHKGIRSHNILFLNSSSSSLSNSPTLPPPLLLGFDYTRPNAPTVASSSLTSADARTPNINNLYRHPRAQGPTRARFCQAYDIYALGIVLLEIGLWRPITELWRPSYVSAEIFQRTLREHYVPRLGGRVGKLYMDVVGRCLGGDMVDDDGEESEGRREEIETERGETREHEENAFYWNVVRELARLVA
jgi:serine/threonine protein kinase